MKRLWANKKLRWVLLGVVVLAAGAAAWGMLPGKSIPAMAVSPQLLEDVFWEDGMVRAEQRSAVSTGLSGQMVGVLVKEGQAVKKGDLLFQLDSAALEAELALLKAERDGVLAGWEQSKDAAKQQIAAVEAQRAGYQPGAGADQISLLTWSMNPEEYGSVAWSYRQMERLAEARLALTDSQLHRAEGGASAGEQSAQAQLQAAISQSLTIQGQKSQYVAQQQERVLDLEAKLANETDENEKARIWTVLDGIRKAEAAYDEMQRMADAQVSGLREAVNDARDQTPEAVDALRTQQLALVSELSALKEQYNQYQLSTRSQILTLSAQQEQAAAASGQLGKQIDLLKQSIGENSGSASYYAALLAKAEAGIADVERRIAQAAILAPIDGVVGAFAIREGQYVQAGMELTEVIDPGSLQVECMLLTDDADAVSELTPVSIVWERRDGDVEYEATIAARSALAENTVSAVGLNEQRVKVRLTPQFEGEGHPKDGYQVRVCFTTNSQTALVVPRDAVVKTEAGDAVYVLAQGRAVLTPVRLGMESGKIVAVVSGLQAGDVVLKTPEADNVEDGAAYRAAHSGETSASSLEFSAP